MIDQAESMNNQEQKGSQHADTPAQADTIAKATIMHCKGHLKKTVDFDTG